MTEEQRELLNRIHGWCDFEPFYDEIAQWMPDNFKAVELGTWLGRSILYLAVRLKDLGKHGQLYGVDHFQGTKGDVAFEEILQTIKESPLDIFNRNIDQLGVRDLVIPVVSDTIDAARLHTFKDGHLDFVFHDSRHTYDFVRNEIIAWRPLVKYMGIQAGHDYSHFQTVRDAVDEVFPNRTIVAPCWKFQT